MSVFGFRLASECILWLNEIGFFGIKLCKLDFISVRWPNHRLCFPIDPAINQGDSLGISYRFTFQSRG